MPWRATLRHEYSWRRLVMLSLALMLATACDSNDSVTPGGPTGPTIPSIGGTYTSSSMWRFDQVRASDGVSTVLTCAGGLTIASQLADSFSGTFFVQDATCGTAAGSVTSGTLRTDGAITFALTSAGTDPNFLTAAFGCTYVSGDTVMTGTISGTTLQAQSNTVMDCPLDGGRLTLNVRVSGTK